MLQKYIAYRLPTLTITLFNLFPTKTSLYFLKAKMCYSVFIIANIPVKTKCLCVNLATLSIIPLLLLFHYCPKAEVTEQPCCFAPQNPSE